MKEQRSAGFQTCNRKNRGVGNPRYSRLGSLSHALAALLLATSGILLRAAPGDMDVLVASDRTEAGKNFAPPTEKTPCYCLIASAGPMEMGEAGPDEKIPADKEVAPLVMKALGQQHYLPINNEHPDPTLLIIYTWGSINPDTLDVDTGNEAGDTTSVQLNTKQMLGIVATNKVDLSPNGVDRDLFLPPLDEGRYFLLVGAYDYAAIKAGKPHAKAMLWRTRLSIYNTGGGADSLAEALPRMLESGAASFGADGYPKQLLNKSKKGTVKIGEAKVVEYIVSGTDVRPAPPPKPKQ